jgi:hypothetical protein
MTATPPKTLNLQIVTEQFAAAVATMELAWTNLKADRENRRLLVRYIRALRRCERLRQTLDHLLKTGNL